MNKVLLEDCCEILDSQRVPITSTNRVEGPYPYYGANGIQDHVADFIFDDELVLLAEDGGNFGSKDRPIAYRVSGKCWVNNHAHVLKPKAGIDVDYLCYSLMFYNVDGMVNGATRQKLTQAAMRQILIPMRSMEEQQYIVSVIKKTESIIQSRQRQIEEFDKLIKARFVEMFGDLKLSPKWELIRISEICDEVVDCINKTAPVVDCVTEYKMLRTTNVRNGYVDVENVKYVEQEVFDKWTRRSIPRRGDLLLTREAPVGEVGMIRSDEYVFLGQRLVSYRVNATKANATFLMYQMKTRYFQDVLGDSAKGSTVKHIPVPDCTEFPVYVPPIERQNQFAEFVKQVDKSKVAVQKALDETKLLFDSLMQQYFG